MPGSDPPTGPAQAGARSALSEDDGSGIDTNIDTNIDWAAIREAYEGDLLTVAEICARHGIGVATLFDRRAAEGWPARSWRRDAGPGGGRPARRGRGLASANLTRRPVDAAAVRLAYEGSDATISEITARFRITKRELTRLRIAGGWKARRPIAVNETGPDAPPAPKAVRRSRPARAVARRLLKTIETQLSALEAKMSDDTATPSPEDARLVGELTRSLDRLARLTDDNKPGNADARQAARSGSASRTGTGPQGDADIEAADLEWRRQRLRTRVARLVGRGRSAGAGGQGEPAGD